MERHATFFSLHGISRSIAQRLWCVVVPRVSLDAGIGESRCPDQLKRVLMHSRPLFVMICLECTKENPWSGRDMIDYLDKLVAKLATTVSQMKKRSEEFELGQFALFLCTSFKLAEKHANLIDGHFARLDDRDPIDLTIDSDNNLCVGNVDWEGRCVFPSPDDDMLLYLSMTGGPGFNH